MRDDESVTYLHTLTATAGLLVVCLRGYRSPRNLTVLKEYETCIVNIGDDNKFHAYQTGFSGRVLAGRRSCSLLIGTTTTRRVSHKRSQPELK